MKKLSSFGDENPELAHQASLSRALLNRALIADAVEGVLISANLST